MCELWTGDRPLTEKTRKPGGGRSETRNGKLQNEQTTGDDERETGGPDENYQVWRLG